MKKNLKVIKELAGKLVHEFDASLPLKPLPNGAVVYKNYIVKETNNGNWALYDRISKTLIDQFFLKTCALMAAKAHDRVNMSRYNEIKELDNKYWASYSDVLVYKANIKKTTSTERYLILLNKLENSNLLATHFQTKISQMFKWSFV